MAVTVVRVVADARGNLPWRRPCRPRGVNSACADLVYTWDPSSSQQIAEYIRAISSAAPCPPAELAETAMPHRP